MAHGLVIVDDETIGTWKTVDGSRPGKRITITIDDIQKADAFLELAREHGAAASFLEWETDPEENGGNG